MKIDNFYYNGQTGHASTTITDKHGHIYVGMADCHPDDAKYKSEQIGRDLSYMRAIQDKQTQEIAIERENIKIIEDFIKNVESYKDYDEKDKVAYLMRHQLGKRKKHLAAMKKDRDVTKWIIKEIVNKGLNLDNVLLKLESAMDKEEV